MQVDNDSNNAGGFLRLHFFMTQSCQTGGTAACNELYIIQAKAIAQEVNAIAKKFQHEINGQIRDRELRVIGPDGKMLGVMIKREAQRIADENNLDLVKVSPNAKPPVCKILDYGKFRYEEERRAKEAKKNQKTVIIKEVRMSVRVEEHDFAVKAKNCIKFLEQGNRVKVSVRFRGREMAYTDRGRQVLLDFADRVSD
ncbi:MAG: translation initiation factor IF-3, partial [Eubacteriaceae bacterium]